MLWTIWWESIAIKLSGSTKVAPEIEGVSLRQSALLKNVCRKALIRRQTMTYTFYAWDSYARVKRRTSMGQTNLHCLRELTIFLLIITIRGKMKCTARGSHTGLPTFFLHQQLFLSPQIFDCPFDDGSLKIFYSDSLSAAPSSGAIVLHSFPITLLFSIRSVKCEVRHSI